ncbi:metal-sensing transcriptional repressor [Bosea sp. LjRoot9]|uniref:metal-sensing transcriptional repressor n=1 Tax=Bosea sp. LjRoot9 TaxID=3342341 RepID=UPI003ECFAF74
MSEPHVHASHPDIARRPRRAEGQLRKVIEMTEAGRNCLDIAQQLQAVESAVAGAKRTPVQDHLDHCLEHAVGAMSRDQRQSIDAFKAITKYL